MALSTQVPLLPGESVRVQFTLPDHTAPFLAESTICWSKTGHLGVRFVSISDEHKSELQVWLSQKLEQTLPRIRCRAIPKGFRHRKPRRHRTTQKEFAHRPASRPCCSSTTLVCSVFVTHESRPELTCRTSNSIIDFSRTLRVLGHP
jgi:hypothetical protein